MLKVSRKSKNQFSYNPRSFLTQPLTTLKKSSFNILSKSFTQWWLSSVAKPLFFHWNLREALQEHEGEAPAMEVVSKLSKWRLTWHFISPTEWQKAFNFKLRAQNSFEELFVSSVVPGDFTLILHKLTGKNIFTLNVILVHKITANKPKNVECCSLQVQFLVVLRNSRICVHIVFRKWNDSCCGYS